MAFDVPLITNVSSEGTDSEDKWTVVSKGLKQPAAAKATFEPGASSIPAPPNSFLPISPIASPAELASSDVDTTPKPNPLMDRLKIIDEKEGRDLKPRAV